MRIQCIICTIPFEPFDSVLSTDCGHLYHTECLDDWFKTSETCPQCRKTISKENLIRIFFDVDDQPFNCEPIFSMVQPSAPDADNLMENLLTERESQTKIIQSQQAEISCLKQKLANFDQTLDDLYVARGQLNFHTKKLLKILKSLDVRLNDVSSEIHSPLSTESCIQSVQLWDKLEGFITEWLKNPKQAQLKTYKSELIALRQQNEELKKNYNDHLAIINRLETIGAQKVADFENLEREMINLYDSNASLLKLLSDKDSQLAADNGNNYKAYFIIAVVSVFLYVYLFAPVERLF